MSADGKLDRRGFLRSAAVGATSLAVGAAACKGKARAGNSGTPDGDITPDAAGASSDGGTADGELGPGAPVDASPEKAGRKQPNVIFILADQWRAQSIGYAGDSNARTPTLDRLAGESVTFVRIPVIVNALFGSS